MQRQPLRITHQLERLYLSGILTSEATTRGFNATMATMAYAAGSLVSTNYSTRTNASD